jgi:osmoprotectant transport system permease protein
MIPRLISWTTPDPGGNGLPGLHRVPIWFNDPLNWKGPDGLLAYTSEHIVYTIVVLAVAMVIAVPLGLLIGHTGRGSAAIGGSVNALRAVPPLGLLILLIAVISPHIHIARGFTYLIAQGSVPYFIPAMAVLLVLAISPILTSTYAGVQAIDPAVRDAARGMGMRPVQVVTRVEFPNALPLIMSGIRSATLQVIATMTVAAYAPLVGGIGRLIVDGDQDLTSPRYGYPAMVAGGITVAVLALAAEGLLALLQRGVVSRGTGRYSTSREKYEKHPPASSRGARAGSARRLRRSGQLSHT